MELSHHDYIYYHLDDRVRWVGLGEVAVNSGKFESMKYPVFFVATGMDARLTLGQGEEVPTN
jgi:hypothetical protein